MNLEILAAVISLVATISAAILSNFVSSQADGVFSLRKSREEDVSKTIVQSETTEQKRDRHLKNRLNELRAAIGKYGREARVTRWSDNLLTTGQVIAGATLATSIIQESLSSQVVGMLGLVVLVATIIHQRYRPDVKSRIARAKVSLLRSSLRRIEDILVISDSPDKTRIINQITRVLNGVDEDKEWEVEEEPDPRADQRVDVNE